MLPICAAIQLAAVTSEAAALAPTTIIAFGSPV